MNVKILKPFDYAHDGIRSKRLEAGETHAVRDHLVDGLVEGGFVAKPKGAAGASEDDARAKAEAEAAAKAQAQAEAKSKADAEAAAKKAKADAEAAKKKAAAATK